MRRFARLQQVHASVCGNGPVVVFAAAVDAFKRFLMQQRHHAMLLGNALDQLHHQLVVIGGDVGRREHRRQLMLSWSDLIMFGLGADAQLPQLFVQLIHELLHTRLDGAEIMVFHLLPLRRRRAKQRASGIDQIFALFIVFFVYQEIFLLAADGRAQGMHIFVAKQFQDAQALAVDGLHAAQQRRLLVQRVAGIRTECRRDAEHIVLDKRIRSRVPGRIAAGLKRRAQTAIRERRRVRFTTDQFFAGKLHHDLAMTIRYDEAVVFFCRYAGQRLEPVREVGRAFLQRPLLHRVGDRIGNLGIQAAAITDGLLQLFKCVFGQTLTHLLFVEYHGSKQFANSCLHRFHSP